MRRFLCWFDEFTDPAHARQLYTTPFTLVDITVTPDEQIMQHRRVILLELVQKHIRQRDLLVMGYTTHIQRETLFNYMARCGDAVDFSTFFRSLARRAPQHKEELMTIAERLHAAGWNDGKQEGRQEEALRIARTMLENGIDREAVLKITGIPSDTLRAHGL